MKGITRCSEKTIEERSIIVGGGNWGKEVWSLDDGGRGRLGEAWVMWADESVDDTVHREEVQALHPRRKEPRINFPPA